MPAAAQEKAMPSQNRVSLAVIIIVLVAAGGLLWWNVRQLDQSKPAPVQLGAQQPVGSIHALIESGDKAGVERLLTAGRKPDEILAQGEGWRRGMTPLMTAALAGKPEVCGVLLTKGSAIEARSVEGKTPLIYAAQSGDVATIRVLLAANARVDARSNDQWTPLTMAAMRGTAESLEVLLQAGANVDARNKWGQTALIAAAAAGDADKITTLLKFQADPNARDQEGNTALAKVVGAGVNGSLATKLLEAGADVNAANDEGMTPLMKAADRGDRDMLVLLLNAGAKPALKDRSGRTAADWAKARDDEAGAAVARVLQDAN
jgi:ankyrin repeat protein